MTLTQIKPAGLSKPVDLADNEKIRLGTGNDLEIYHNGSHSIIHDNGTGALKLIADEVALQATNDETTAKFIENGAVELYHNGIKKFETTAGGVQFAGTEIKGPDNCKFVAGTSGDADFYHDGSATYIRNMTGDLCVRSDNNILLQPYSGDELFAKFVNDGAVELYYDNSKKLETTSLGVSVTGNIYGSQDLILSAGGTERLNMTHTGGGAFVIKNPSAASLSFGTNNQNSELHIANGGAVGIGTSTPNEKLEVAGNCRLSSGGATRTLHMGPASAGIEYNVNGTTFIQGRTDAYPLAFKTSSTERVRIDANGRLLKGTTSAITLANNPNTQIVGTSTSDASLALIRQSNGGGEFVLAAGASGSNIASGNGLGFIKFMGYHTNGYDEYARIQSYADGTTGDGDAPGRLVFATTTDGSASPSERMRINSDGAVMIGCTVSRPAEFNHPDGLSIRGDVTGQLQNTVTDNMNMLLNRDGTDGTMIGFRKDGTGIGAIGVSGSDIYFQFGSTATSAHQLDDYEEGSFTPTISGPTSISYSEQYGRYVKVGKLVTVNVRMQFSGNSSGGYFKILGLPFAGASGEGETYGSGGITYCSVPLSTVNYDPYIGSSGTSINFYQKNSGGNITLASNCNNAYIGVAAFYYV